MNAKQGLGLSAIGLLMIALHEGFSSTPYLDTGGVVTNGFGNAKLNPSREVTVVQGLQDLKENTSFFDKAVSECIKVPMTQGQHDAYVSFAFNVGANAFCRSTMARKANAGDKVGSCNEFDRWVFVAGKDCRIRANNCGGIVKRRQEEKQLCLS